MVFRYEHGLGVVREVSVSWNWRVSTVFGKHWSVFGCSLGGVCQREVILNVFWFLIFTVLFFWEFSFFICFFFLIHFCLIFLDF